jgi:hypothetical protein
MKKVLIALFVISALAFAASSFGFDLNLKKKSCEKACDTTYDECVKKAQEDFEKGKDKAKKLAQETSCKAAKDECYKKCK